MTRKEVHDEIAGRQYRHRLWVNDNLGYHVLNGNFDSDSRFADEVLERFDKREQTDDDINRFQELFERIER